MLDLNEFIPVDLGNGPCSITLTLNSIIFSRGLLERLKRPDYIKVCISQNEKMLIVAPADSTDPYAVDMTRMPLRGRINNREFVKRLKTLTGYKEDDTIKIVGQYIAEQNLILFKLIDVALVVSEL